MKAKKSYRPWSPDQGHLLPPSPRDWLAEDHLAYFILDILEELDVGPIEAKVQAKDHRGTRPYDPRMMTALFLYGYAVGVYSSRKIEQATYDDLAFRVIAAGAHPDHSVISEFRRANLDELAALHRQSVQLAMSAGLVTLKTTAIDGTKIQANASKHKAMSYDRMMINEKKLEALIRGLYAEAERIDAEEDALYGKGVAGPKVPEELKTREGRLRAIRRAKAELEAEARQAKAEDLQERAEKQRQSAESSADPVERKRAATRAKKNDEKARKLREEDDDDGPPASSGGLPHHRVPTTKEGKPRGEAQRNFTDPDSRIMKRDGTYLQGYNCQTVVDSEQQIILSCGVTNQAPDQQHLPGMVELAGANCGAYPQELLADNGYWDEAHVDFCQERGIDPYIATEKVKHGQVSDPPRGRIPKNLDAKGRMHRKLRTKKGRETYSRRKVIAEPPFGQIREARGFHRFLLRGLEKVRGEWSMVCAGHNLLKIYRHRMAVPTS